jgi:hypothetical protein
MSQVVSYTSSPQASPTGLLLGSPELVTGYDDRGFTTVRTIYHGTTAAPTLQNNAEETAVLAAPAQKGAGSKMRLAALLGWAIVLFHIPGCVGW